MKIALLLTVVALLVLSIYFAFSSPGYFKDAKSVEQKIKSSVGESRLRCWATNILAQYRHEAERTGDFEFPKTEVPSWLVSLGSPWPFSGGTVCVHPRSEEYVSLGWVSSLGGTVVHVGRTNFVEKNVDADLYCIRCADGIFILTPKR
jgi:hypothetical protein